MPREKSQKNNLCMFHLLIGEGIDNRLQYSSLKNTMDKGPWWATVHIKYQIIIAHKGIKR